MGKTKLNAFCKQKIGCHIALKKMSRVKFQVNKLVTSGYFLDFRQKLILHSLIKEGLVHPKM